MNWWWLGAKGSSLHKLVTGDDPSKYRNVALIIGVTGLSGNSLANMLKLPNAPGGRWKVYGVGLRPEPEWQFHHNLVEYFQYNMIDHADCLTQLPHLNEVTHVFYVGWVTNFHIENEIMLRNVLNVIIHNATSLRHICLQTGQKYALPLGSSGEIQEEPKYVRDYTMEEIFLKEVLKKENLTWSIHCPAVMFGFSPYSTGNIVGSLCVYATICNYEGQPLRFPGTHEVWNGCLKAADADLVAEQQVCAAMHYTGNQEKFDCSNNDPTFRWSELWMILADEFEVVAEFKEGSPTLEKLMQDKGPLWDQIVEEKDLLPTKLEEVATWWYIDYVLRQGVGAGDQPSQSEVFINTAKSFRYWIKHTRKYNIVPCRSTREKENSCCGCGSAIRFLCDFLISYSIRILHI